MYVKAHSLTTVEAAYMITLSLRTNNVIQMITIREKLETYIS
jgi:hypothetical protein